MAEIKRKPIPELSQTEIDRFWGYVDKRGPNECWVWTGGCTSRGYGAFTAQKTFMSAHRVVFKLHYGYDPHPETLHSCDNPPCCNPAHLSAGTAKDNAVDRSSKGRGPIGDRHWTHKYPEMVKRGDDNAARRLPHLLARGDRNGARLHPERHPRGERIGTSKLTAAQVIEIRQRYADGEHNKSALSRDYGVSPAMICYIVAGKSWRITSELAIRSQ
jgi:hypothetical protein